MIDPVWLKTLVKTLVLPPAGPLIVCVLGLLVWSRRPRAGRALVTGGIALLLILSIPAVASLLLRSLPATALQPPQGADAQAIVILGSGTRRDAPEYGGDTVSATTLERVRYGARLARITGLPVLVSGGAVFGGTAEAPLMADLLEHELGVRVRWVEDRSRNTHENAVLAAAVLREASVRRIVLVAHAFHMPRAAAEFRAQGLDVTPAPTGLPGSSLELPFALLPSAAGLQGSYYALHEWLGLFAQQALP